MAAVEVVVIAEAAEEEVVAVVIVGAEAAVGVTAVTGEIVVIAAIAAIAVAIATGTEPDSGRIDISGAERVFRAFSFPRLSTRVPLGGGSGEMETRFLAWCAANSGKSS